LNITFVYDDDDLLLLKQTYLGGAWAERPVIAKTCQSD
jgi:hypothetical protein